MPVFQNLIHLKVVREMSRDTIDILLDMMQRTPNLRILEIAEVNDTRKPSSSFKFAQCSFSDIPPSMGQLKK